MTARGLLVLLLATGAVGLVVGVETDVRLERIEAATAALNIRVELLENQLWGPAGK